MPLLVSTPDGKRCRYRVSRAQVDIALWPEIISRHAAGESLRALGRAYGVSYEAIRQIVTRAATERMQECGEVADVA